MPGLAGGGWAFIIVIVVIKAAASTAVAFIDIRFFLIIYIKVYLIYLYNWIVHVAMESIVSFVLSQEDGVLLNSIVC